MADSILTDSIISASQEQLLEQVPAFQHRRPLPSPSPPRLKLCGLDEDSESEPDGAENLIQQNNSAFCLEYAIEFVSPEAEEEEEEEVLVVVEEEEDVEEVEEEVEEEAQEPDKPKKVVEEAKEVEEEEEEEPEEVEEEEEPEEVEEEEELKEVEEEEPKEVEEESEHAGNFEKETEHPEEIAEEEAEEERRRRRRKNGDLDDSYDSAFESDRSRSISPQLQHYRPWDAFGDGYSSRLITQSQGLAEIEKFQGASMDISLGIFPSIRSLMFPLVNNSSKFEDPKKKATDEGHVGEQRDQEEVKGSSFVKDRKRNLSQMDGVEEEKEHMSLGCKRIMSERTDRYAVSGHGKEEGETRCPQRSSNVQGRKSFLDKGKMVNLDSENVQNSDLLVCDHIEGHNVVILGSECAQNDIIDLDSETAQNDPNLVHRSLEKCEVVRQDLKSMRSDCVVHENWHHVVNQGSKNAQDYDNPVYNHIREDNVINLGLETAPGDDNLVHNHIKGHSVLDPELITAQNNTEHLVHQHSDRDLDTNGAWDNRLERRSQGASDQNPKLEIAPGKRARGIAFSSLLKILKHDTTVGPPSMKNASTSVQGKVGESDCSKRDLDLNTLASSSSQSILERDKVNVCTTLIDKAAVKDIAAGPTMVQHDSLKQLIVKNSEIINLGNSLDINVENVNTRETSIMDMEISELVPDNVKDVVMCCSGHLSPPMPHDPDLLSLVIGTGVSIPLPFRDCTGKYISEQS